MKPPSILDDSSDPANLDGLSCSEERGGLPLIAKIAIGALAAVLLLFVPVLGLILAALVVACYFLWRIGNQRQ